MYHPEPGIVSFQVQLIGLALLRQKCIEIHRAALQGFAVLSQDSEHVPMKVERMIASAFARDSNDNMVALFHSHRRNIMKGFSVN